MLSMFFGGSERKRLAELRRHRFGWDKPPPYGKPVQIRTLHICSKHPIGTVGVMLSEKDHGVTQHDGWAEMTPNFPGIRGIDFLVRFGNGNPEIVPISDLSPA